MDMGYEVHGQNGGFARFFFMVRVPLSSVGGGGFCFVELKKIIMTSETNSFKSQIVQYMPGQVGTLMYLLNCVPSRGDNNSCD